MNKAKEMDGTLAISGNEMLDMVEAAPHTIAQPVSSCIVRDDNLVGAIAGYDSFCVHMGDRGTEYSCHRPCRQ
ncbi:hypothetical protein [Komagataeibacter sp. FNDCF1]|uniref:hypothetical protein n=1 Tax=Komagataeibacter sp. FNDCF1 TaxID=2878681 RepID=UPI001E5F1D3A|nr:hypothetical protein [Komagataeibacter sp. FNDCF1]MCE2564128.1 hypothetical protein [Komagataeibacter sp. FNDCF1]